MNGENLFIISSFFYGFLSGKQELVVPDWKSVYLKAISYIVKLTYLETYQQYSI